MGQTVSFPRPDGQRVQGYLAEPASPHGAPGVVIIQEWWGLNDQIRGVADHYAEQGYRDAFFNETQVGDKKLLPVVEYDPDAAQLAWQRTLAFFGRHLS